MAGMTFKKAVKHEAKGRMALVGPAGSGKSYTALVAARALAGADGKIAAVDTEHGSLSKYADLFEFDVFEMDSFSPSNFMDALKAAEDNGYAVFVCDSLSHFWMGRDGALEYVDNAKKRSQSRDDMSGWKDFSPIERRMIDAMIASPCHVIVTMRTKTEWQEEEYTNGRGEKKKKRVKIGLQPVQRQGLEYEFDLIGYMDEDNNLLVEKTRCPEYSKNVMPAPKASDFQPFVAWLSGVKREPEHVAKFQALQSLVGDETYFGVLGAHGFEDAAQIRDVQKAREIYREISEAHRAKGAAA
jgi:energy-coupling factor transporter ATP-binding protein EcfA2